MSVLRPRPEARGGPFLEFPCPGCRVVLHLVPHGHGRYAEPGEPPPPPPDARERRVPWSKAEEPAASASPEAIPAVAHAASPSAPKAAAPPSPPAGAPPAARRVPRDPPPPVLAPPAPDAAPLTPAAAERLLKLLPGYTAADVERAFRRRALLCHPDKV